MIIPVKYSDIPLSGFSNRNYLGQFREIPRNQTTIYFDNANDNVTLTLYNVTLTSQKPYY